jgi:CelD/BcsL family acetyltransferase involved in cellulose biosynthesis
LWSCRPLRVVRFLGHGPGDALGPICRSSDRPAVASALLRALEDWGGGVVIGDELPCDEGWSTLLGAKTLRRDASPVLALDGVTWESLLASKSKNLRYRIHSRERRLADQHRLRYRLAVDPERFGRDFDRLVALHRARWPEGSSFTDAESFHREFAAAAFARGWCRLWLLEVDGEARAAWYGFRFANVESYYQAGRDPRWDRYSLGFLALAHSIREAAADGVREYRFLRGGEDFKYRFASHDPGLETIAVGRGSAGRVAVEAVARLPTPLLRRFA